MSRAKQTSKRRGRSRVVTALGVAGALSLAGGASASISPAGDIPTRNTAPVLLAEEEISDVSLATFYVFDKENAGAHRSGRTACRQRVRTRRLQRLRSPRRLQRLRPRRLQRLRRAQRLPWLRGRRLRRLRRRMRRRLLYMDWTSPGLLICQNTVNMNSEEGIPRHP